MRGRLLLLAIVCVCAVGGRSLAEDESGGSELERRLLATPTAERLRAWHDLLCAEPHVAGTPADERMIAKLVGAFTEMGLEVSREDFHAYLPRYGSAELGILGADGSVTALPLQEAILPEDPYSEDRALTPGWNAYSGSGTATGEVVYANYGTKQDFERLRELGVSCAGRIVLARYGKCFRGYKAKFAEEAGAAGVVLYTDPDDSGWRKGLMWPEGGWANESQIQRGSIITLPYVGDPLTPFMPASVDGIRIDPDMLALPHVPVQPVAWKAASQILSRMRGEVVPEGWQGGLPFPYRVTGGAELVVRLHVEQPREILPSANVIGMVRGTEEPQRLVLVGCHFDAWGFGAGDPHAGSIVLLEMARSFAEAARAGVRPRRTVVFCNWGAEEMGIIGSTEWVEAHAGDLSENAVAYLNLDMAAMGPRFDSSAAPLLQSVIEEAAKVVPQARGGPGETVYEAWAGEGAPSFGTLGGGSDHVGFYCHLGIPSASLGGGGSPGTSDHSAYDDLAWYRRIVGDDYEPALMLARMGNVIVSRLANAPLLPLDAARYAPALADHLKALAHWDAEVAHSGFPGLEERLLELAASSAHLGMAAEMTESFLERALASGALDAATRARVNARLLSLERRWLRPAGLEGRPWYRNLYAVSDPDTGYAAWPLPRLRDALAAGNVSEAGDALTELHRVLVGLAEDLSAIADALPADAR